jgi:alpha-amylase
LRHYTAFDAGSDYFNDWENGQTLRDAVRRRYLPANALLLELIEKHRGRFRFAFGMTGVLMEQLRDVAPEAIRSFQVLAETGCVEFLARAYQENLSFRYSPVEFAE